MAKISTVAFFRITKHTTSVCQLKSVQRRTPFKGIRNETNFKRLGWQHLQMDEWNGATFVPVRWRQQLCVHRRQMGCSPRECHHHALLVAHLGPATSSKSQTLKHKFGQPGKISGLTQCILRSAYSIGMIVNRCKNQCCLLEWSVCVMQKQLIVATTE